MEKILRIVCVLVFIAGLVKFSSAYRIQSNQDDIEPPLPFVASYIESRVTPDGTRIIEGKRTRYVKANGEWKEIVRAFKPGDQSPEDSSAIADTKGAVVYSGLPEGAFAKPNNSDERKFVSPSPGPGDTLSQKFKSHEYLRNHKEFVRTEEFAGLKIYVLRSETPYYWTEVSYSSKTGRNPLSNIAHFNDGSEKRIELTKIEFNEVPENLNDDMKALPNTGKLKNDK